MTQFLQKLQSLLHIRSGQQMEDTAFNEILDRSFSRLRNVDPETDQQWLRLQSGLSKVDGRATMTTSAKSQLTPRTGWIPRLALGVAITAVAIVVGYFYFSSTQYAADTFATGKGEQKEIVLSDRSKVILNYTSQLVVQKLQPGQPRRVSLAGEAYFYIQPSETPFIVSTDYGVVQVVGTEFNLRARGGALEVAVLSGVVDVSAVKDGKDSTLLLSQHQMALVPQNDFPRRTGDIPSPDYPGWMHGKLFLDRTSFQAACREIEMRFDVSIKTDNQLGQSDIITGILNAKTAESAVAALCELTGRKFKHDGQEFHVY